MELFFRLSCFALTFFFALAALFGLRIVIDASGYVSFVFCLVLAGAIVALLICSRAIWEVEDMVHFAARLFWCAALVAGFYLVYVFSAYYIVLGMTFKDPNAIDWAKLREVPLSRRVMAYLATAFLPMSALAASFLTRSGLRPESSE